MGRHLVEGCISNKTPNAPFPITYMLAPSLISLSFFFNQSWHYGKPYIEGHNSHIHHLFYSSYSCESLVLLQHHSDIKVCNNWFNFFCNQTLHIDKFTDIFFPNIWTGRDPRDHLISSSPLYNEGKQPIEGQEVTYSSSSIRFVAKSGLEPRSSGSKSDPLSTTSSCNSSRNCASSPGSGSSPSWGSSMSWGSSSLSTFISQLHRETLVAWLELFFSLCLLLFVLPSLSFPVVSWLGREQLETLSQTPK